MSIKTFRFFKLIFIVLLTLTSSGCFNLVGDSTNSFVKDKVNIERTKKAILFVKEGGATVADSYQLSIVDYSTAFDKAAKGNTFIVDGDHGRARLTPESVVLTWRANDTLLITYDKKLRIFLQEKAIDGVVVNYKDN